jgi:hypothetical protein
MSAFDSKKTETSSGNSTVDPWAPQAAALTGAFANANNAYNQSSTAKAPTDFTAQMTPEQLATYHTMIAQGGDTTAATNAANAGTALTGAGTTGVTGALSGLGGFNANTTNNPDALVAAANKYVGGQNIDAQVNDAMLNARQTARDVTMPGIEQHAAITGNTNSSRTGIADGLVERGLAEQSGNLGASLRSTAFQNGLTLAQQQAAGNNTTNVGALSNQGTIGNAAVNSGVNAGTQSIADNTAQGALASAGGAGLQAADQANLTNQNQQYQSGVNSPYASLQQLMSIIGGSNWGSTTNSTGTKTQTNSPSLISDISSGVGTLTDLAKTAASRGMGG